MSDAPDHVQECAEWFAESHSRYWQSRRLLLDYVGDKGPIRLADGRLLGFQPDGLAWDDEAVAELFPALIQRAEVAFTGTRQQVERVLSLALEEVPDIAFKVTHKVDATAANAMVRAGGDAAEKLLPHRVQKSKLGVR